MRIAVTGSGGFTGRHFCRQALAAGHEVVPITADLSDFSALRDQVQESLADAVLHLAGVAFVGASDARSFYDVNLFGTINLLDALVASSSTPRRVIVVSSGNVYGNLGGHPIPETQCPAPVNHYAASKLAMEHIAQTYADRLSLVVARPFNYTGVGQSLSFVIPKIVHHFATKADRVRLGNVHVQREYNDVRLVCQSYLRLLEVKEPPRIVNLCTGRTWNLTSVISILESITQHKLKVETDQNLIRHNEVHQLCGDPERLWATIGQVEVPPLQETLAWMVRHEEQPSDATKD